MSDYPTVADWPDFMVQLLADDIEFANTLNPQCWTLYSYKGFGGNRPSLGVGMNSILYFNPPNRAFFAMDKELVPEELLPEIETSADLRDYTASATLSAQLDVEFLKEHLEQLMPAHHSLIERMSPYNKAGRWKWHNQGFLDAFAKRLSSELPSPGYIADIAHLHSSEPSSKYRSQKVQPTGYWYQTFDRNRENENQNYELSIERDLLVHNQDPLEDCLRLPTNRASFIRESLKHDGIGQGFAHRNWLFVHGMIIGDWVVIRHDFPAIGEITGEYEEIEGKATRSVRWHWVSKEPVPQTIFSRALKNRNLWGFTALEPIEFRRVIEALGKTDIVDVSNISVPSPDQQTSSIGSVEPTTKLLQISYAESGLNYTNTQIADFYTALQTKGFVILSGISGTGKSKIAQGFTRFLPNATITEIAGPDPITAQQALQFRVSDTETWAAVSADQSHLFPHINQNTKYDVDFIFEGGTYRGSYKTRTLNFGKPTLYFIMGNALAKRLRRAAGQESIYAQFRAAPNEDSLAQISISLEKPATEATTQQVETLELSNTLFLSVRPDWRDGTSLLGYYNPLTQTYEWTDFLRFILNASENYRSENPIAWFLILDEMNLAHVEYYFSDLLSVLESGRIDDPNHPDYGFTREALRITYPEIVENEAPPGEIHLPPNLYIVGTVNMDETTHAFSPKVLDRAFTIELTDVDFTDYPTIAPQVSDSLLNEESTSAFLQAFSQDGSFPQIRKSEIYDFVQSNPAIRESLQQLNSELANQRFHFGYRVFDEIMQFLANAEANGMYDSLESALDSAAFMKILPKFSGSEARVGRPLTSLITWASDPFEDGETVLQRTLDRALFMQDVLKTDGFVTAF